MRLYVRETLDDQSFCIVRDMNETPVESPSPPNRQSVFGQRLLSTVILLALLAGTIAWGNVWGFRILLCLFCILASWEWNRMLKMSGKPGQPWLSLTFGVLYPIGLSFICESDKIFGYILAAAVAPVAIVLLTVVSFIWEMRRPIVGSRSLRSVGNTLVSFIFPVWMISAALPMLELGKAKYAVIGLPYGVQVLIWVVVVTKMADIFAYLSGMAMGGRIFKGKRMIPHISPKKTWEGLIGSYILTIAAGGWLGIGMGVLQEFSLMYLSLMTLMFILAVFGDLAGSLIKRSLSVKDSGSLLPGIGGVFDLIDSPAFTIPIVFYLDGALQLTGYSGLFF